MYVAAVVAAAAAASASVTGVPSPAAALQQDKPSTLMPLLLFLFVVLGPPEVLHLKQQMNEE